MSKSNQNLDRMLRLLLQAFYLQIGAHVSITFTIMKTLLARENNQKGLSTAHTSSWSSRIITPGPVATHRPHFLYPILTARLRSTTRRKYFQFVYPPPPTPSSWPGQGLMHPEQSTFFQEILDRLLCQWQLLTTRLV